MPKKGRRSSKANASSNSSPNTNNEGIYHFKNTLSRLTAEHANTSAIVSETKNKRKRIEEKENHEKDNGVPSRKVKKVTLKFSGQEQSFTPKNDEEEENLTQNKKDTVNNEQINNNIIANKKTVSIIDLLDIIHKLYKEDQQGIFYYPVNEAEAPGYSSIILHPMDLSTLKARLCQLKYKTVGQFKVSLYSLYI
jgi:bromodomain-containing protein 7/9